MSKTKKKALKPRHLGQYKDWWLEQTESSPYWYRCWYNPKTKHTERVSLKKTDFRDAETALREFVDSQLEANNADPSKVFLFGVLDWYWANHGKHVAKPQEQSLAIRFWKEEFTATTKVAELLPLRMKKFSDRLIREGKSLGYIDRIMSVGRAAINMARDNLIVAYAPKIKMVQTQQDREEVEPMGRPLEIEEIAKLFYACTAEHIRNYLIIQLNTICRPAAAIGLQRSQIDFGHDRVNLNPAGRRQNKKHRPILPLTPSLRRALLRIEKEAVDARRDEKDYKFERYITFRGRAISSIHRAFQDTVEAAGLAGTNVTLYSVRHTVGRYLRKNRVPSEEVSIFMGHKPRGANKTTAIYAPFDPDYLAEATKRVEEFYGRVTAAYEALVESHPRLTQENEACITPKTTNQLKNKDKSEKAA